MPNWSLLIFESQFERRASLLARGSIHDPWTVQALLAETPGGASILSRFFLRKLRSAQGAVVVDFEMEETDADATETHGYRL